MPKYYWKLVVPRSQLLAFYSVPCDREDLSTSVPYTLTQVLRTLHEFGRLPERGDEIEFAGFHFKVLRADPRRVQLLRVMRTADARAAARGG